MTGPLPGGHGRQRREVLGAEHGVLVKIAGLHPDLLAVWRDPQHVRLATRWKVDGLDQLPGTSVEHGHGVLVPLGRVGVASVGGEVHVARELAGWHLAEDLAGANVDDGDHVVAGDVDRGRLLVWQQHQAVPGPGAEIGNGARYGNPARVDANGLQLVAGKVVGPDQLSVPVRLLVGQPANGRTQRARLACLARGRIDQRDVLRADVEHVDGLGAVRRRHRPGGGAGLTSGTGDRTGTLRSWTRQGRRRRGRTGGRGLRRGWRTGRRR